jgi:hypothetical protein
VTNPTEHARLIYEHANLLNKIVTPAVRALHDAQAGYPPTTPLAGPPDTLPETPATCPNCNLDNDTYCTRHGTIGYTPDKAATTLHHINRELANINQRLARITWTTHQWAPHLTGQDLTMPDATLWCTNCAKHGANSVADRHGLCDWCNVVKKDHGHLPTRRLVEAHATGRRMNLTEYHREFGKPKPVVTTKPDKTAAKERQAKRLRGEVA